MPTNSPTTIEQVIADIAAEEAATIAERKAQYGERFNSDQEAAIKLTYLSMRTGAKRMAEALSRNTEPMVTDAPK